jgi:hypothetical protein
MKPSTLTEAQETEQEHGTEQSERKFIDSHENNRASDTEKISVSKERRLFFFKK